ncbi:hypothetical protein C0J52_13997 [Blattella germanica]|nr:hypothetical protein C0J52_13997 [Blattella germanica]
MHKTGSVVATQRRFRIHFNVPKHGGIPSKKTFLQWVSKLENSGKNERDKLLNEVRLGLDPTNVYFQQDGATVHTARNSMAFLRTEFMSVISRFGDIPWPSCSPDLSIPDFFLWGYLKQNVYMRRLRTLQELKEAIIEEVANIDRDLLQKMFGSFRKRSQESVDCNGRHLEDVIFKK